MKRILASILVSALLVGMFPLSVSAAVGQASQTVISHGLTLSTSHAKLDNGYLRRSFILDYTPGQTTAPLVLYGDKLYGKSNIDTVVNYAERRGYTIMAAVNADYFHMETGLPTGMTVQNGRLCSSDGNWNAVGFRADGTAMIGAPKLSLDMVKSDGTSMHIYALNKQRSANGLYLYSSDFSSTTRTTTPGTEVVLQLNEGDFLKIGKSVTATVVSGGPTASTPIGPNQLVLSLADGNTAGLVLSGFYPGAQVTLSAAAESGWEDVLWSTGGGNMLVKNGQLTADAKTGYDARTILGARDDGSLSVYVCDGRQSSLSSGVSTLEAAQYLLSRGCTSVICLDGGGSTAISARYPGWDRSALQNSPSDGSERACATYILFANTGDRTLPASHATVRPGSGAVLAGATVKLSALTYNSDFFPTGSYQDLYNVSSGSGYVVGNVLYTPVFSDTVTVSADASGLQSDSAVFNVTDKPTSLHLVPAGGSSPLQNITLSPNGTIDVDVWASDGVQRLISQDNQFTFSLSNNLGTVNEQGVITAAGVSGLSGTLTVSYNGVSSSVPVNVGHAPLVLEDFEHGSQWSAEVQEGVTARAGLNIAVENSRYGHNSLHLIADGKSQKLSFTPDRPLTLPSGARTISFLAKGTGRYTLDFASPNGTVSAPFNADVQDWKYCAITIPAGATALTGISAVGETLNHDVYIDQIMSHFGAAANDVKPPEIEIEPFDCLVLTAHVKDNYPFPVEKNMISVKLDGTPLDFAYNAGTGVLTCNVPQREGMHRVTISAQDYFLNYTRKSIVFGSTVACSYKDLAKHWCADYAEYLHIKGIYSDAAKFNPQTNVTNEMAATILSRYLGVDTSKYNNIQLPYTDANKIQSWALPHVRAMYAMGIIRGSVSNGKSVLHPNTPCSRAQIMTILGRTLGRGYSYAPAQFSDFNTAPVWAKDHISLLASVDVISGYGGPTGTVKPNGTITRAEFASLLFKMY